MGARRIANLRTEVEMDPISRSVTLPIASQEVRQIHVTVLLLEKL